MTTIAWLLILMGVIIGRQVSVGRVKDLNQDVSDAFLAITRGDSKTLAEVFSRRGDATTTANGSDPNSLGSGQLTYVGKGGLGTVAQGLGAAAKGYRWAATGPDYYDCSGLMWRACQRIGYTGPRFTTESVLNQKGMVRTLDNSVNTMVLWPAGSGGVTGHIGVITGTDEFYSARSVRSGIGFSKISTFRKTNPIYVRFTP